MNTRLLSATAIVISKLVVAHAQHAHLNVGAAGATQDAPLIFANGKDFDVSSGYVKTLEFTNSDAYAGYYQGGITLTALPQTAANAGPDPAASALGSFLQFRISCLESPAGAAFGFWEAGSTAPSASLRSGQTSTNLWPLSESDASPGSDPYGHIHGRRFTASKPGFYRIGFTAVDTSTNGVGAGPIHKPSAELPVLFQAGVNVRSVEPDFEESHVHIHFAAEAGYSWQLQHRSDLGLSGVWAPVNSPVIGADIMVQMIHDEPPGSKGFYRLVGTPVTP